MYLELIVNLNTAYRNEVLNIGREVLKMNPLATEYLQQYLTRIELSDPYQVNLELFWDDFIFQSSHIF